MKFTELARYEASICHDDWAICESAAREPETALIRDGLGTKITDRCQIEIDPEGLYYVEHVAKTRAVV